jgi:hypothetical protein
MHRLRGLRGVADSVEPFAGFIQVQQWFPKLYFQVCLTF